MFNGLFKVITVWIPIWITEVISGEITEEMSKKIVREVYEWIAKGIEKFLPNKFRKKVLLYSIPVGLVWSTY